MFKQTLDFFSKLNLIKMLLKKIIVYLYYDAARLIKISTLNMIDGSAELLYLNNYNVQDKNKWDLILHQKD